MSNELRISAQGASLTVYTIIRRVSDSKVWDVANTTWATWADGSIDDYDLQLTDKGGDLHQGDFPTSISAGTRVLVYYYSQAGGTPAITDSLLLTEDTQWNGAVLTSSGSISLDSRALTSLASVKRILNLTGDSTHDDLLTELINQVSDRIETKTSRRFAAANYIEWIDGDGVGIQVRNYPIVRVDRVRMSPSNALTVDYTGSDIEATVQVYTDEEGQNGAIRLYSVAADGTETTNTLTFASNATLSAMATAITAVSDWSGAKVPTGDALCESLVPVNGFDAKDQTATLCHLSEYDYDYKVNYRLGQVACRGYRQVKYRGGYETIPDDITQLANKLVARAFKMRDTNEGLKSETIPDYSYSLASQVELTADESSMLQSYSTVGVA